MQVAIPVNSTNASVGSHQASVEALKNLLSMAPNKRQESSSPTQTQSLPTSHSEVAAQPTSHEGQVAALKSLLLAKSPSPITEQTPAPQVNQKNKETKKKSPNKSLSETQEKSNHSTPSNSSSESEHPSKNGSTKKLKKKSTSTKSYFAGSAFQNSPDPTSIPMPDFDDLDEITLDKQPITKVLSFSNVTVSSTSTTVPQLDKSESLRRLLNIQRSA